MKFLSFLLILSLLISCESNIKNKDAKVVVEEGTEVPSSNTNAKAVIEKNNTANTNFNKSKLIGFWVGDFEIDDSKIENPNKKSVNQDGGVYWNRNNKINISIDEIKDGKIIGHSVVAGNDRPFEGTIKINKLSAYNTYEFEVSEPGDNRYDGTFKFTIENNVLYGTWTAYKNIDIKHRKYSLNKKRFQYNKNIMLQRNGAYVNWNKSKEEKVEEEFDGEIVEWMEKEFEFSTNLIYKINASDRLLEKSEVENLKRGDLTIIRNTIYARHGYSFKNRPLRIFFDAQDWYIPVHADIKKDFTTIEKQNIQLLLRYEKNAKTYYDRFGR